ncbi:unnamed protein product [Ixodes hexagonus]
MDGDERNKSEVDSARATLSPRRSVDHVEELPDDILLLVMGLLDLRSRIRLEGVCQRWRHLALRLWKSQRRLSFEGIFSVSQENPPTLDILRALLARCGKSLKTLNLRSVSHMLDDRMAEIVGTLCPNLECLDVSGVQLTDVGVGQLAEKCPKLKTVIMKRCLDVEEKGLCSLLQLCKHLEHLNLTELYKLSGECFDKAGTRLRKLVLRGCSGVTSAGLRQVTTKCLLLTKLSLSDCRQITDDDMLLLCQNLLQLRVLHLAGSFLHLTNEGICAVSSLSLLEELDLNQNLVAMDAAVGAICRGCTKLRSLNISGCHLGVPDTCGRLSRSLQLRDLKMSYLGQITDAGLRSLACHGHLNNIELRGCPQVGDAGELVELSAFLDWGRPLRCFVIAVYGSMSELAIRQQCDYTLLFAGTNIDFEHLSLEPSKVLDINRSNRCIEHLRPDRMERLDHDAWDIDDFFMEEEDLEDDFENEDYLEEALWENDFDNCLEPEDGFDEDEVVAYDYEDWLVHEGASGENDVPYDYEDWVGHEDDLEEEEDDVARDFEDRLGVDDAEEVGTSAPQSEDDPTNEVDLLEEEAYDNS